MSTRPYATFGGLRIRQHYNKAVLRYEAWYRTRAPQGASSEDWLAWKEWVHARYLQMKDDRDRLVADAVAQKRRPKRNGRNSKRRDGAATRAAT